MAPPDIIDFDDIGKFRYVGQGLKKIRRSADAYSSDELNLGDFLDRIREGEPITLDLLHNTTVQVSSGENAIFKNKWMVYRCLVCEMPNEDGTKLFVLSNGEWYSIQQNFVASVRDKIANIPLSTVRLPDFDDAVHTEIKRGNPQRPTLKQKS